MGKTCTFAIVTLSVALAWTGSLHTTIGPIFDKEVSALENTKITDPTKLALIKPLLPPKMDISLCEHGPEIDALGFVFQTPQKTYLSLSQEAFNKAGTDFSSPRWAHVARHEAAHVFHGHGLQLQEMNKNLFLGGVALGAFQLAACVQNIKNPLPMSLAAALLLATPLYYFAGQSYCAYAERQQEFQADSLAYQGASDNELQFLYQMYKRYADKTSNDIYKASFDNLRNGKITRNRFYQRIVHPTGKDHYDMIVAEMRKRGLAIT